MKDETFFLGQFSTNAGSQWIGTGDDSVISNLVLMVILCLPVLVPGHAEEVNPIRFDFSHYELGKPEVDAFLISAAKTPPVIDGKFDEPCWQGRSFRVKPGTAGEGPFHVRAAYDAGHVFLAVKCVGEATKGERAERDSNVWKDDCVEVWVTTGSGKSQRRYQFIVNAANAIYDARDSKRSYNPEWTHATVRSDKEWTVEATFPLAAFGVKQWPHRLPFNVGRNGPGMGHYAWKAYGSADSSALEFHGIAAPADETVQTSEMPPLAGGLVSVEGTALELRMERSGIQAGERFLEIPFRLRTADVPISRLKLKATIQPLGGGSPVASAECVPDRTAGKVVVDMRRLRLSKTPSPAGEPALRAVAGMVLKDGETVLARATVLVSAAGSTSLFAEGARAKVILDKPEGIAPEASWPVTFGVPFPAGALWDAQGVRLLNAKGEEIPHQKEVTGRWGAGGAIQWLRFDALVNSGDKFCFVEASPSTEAAVPGAALSLREQDDGVVIETADYRYVLGKGPSPIREIWLGEHRVATSEGAKGLYVIDQAGRIGTASHDGETMRIEARGPVSACVRFEGFYRDDKGQQMAKHITRVECFAGQPLAKITHTLVLTNDTNKVWFKDIGWEFAAAPGKDAQALFSTDRENQDTIQSVALGDEVAAATMVQDEHYRFATGKNHFRIATIDAGGKATVIREGEEMGDWAALHGEQGGLLFGCRESARQHPKEFEISRSRATLKLYSPGAGEELDFRAPAVAKRCNFEEWHKVAVSQTHRDDQWMERVKKLPSNALGWAKTHELWLAAIPAGAVQAAAKQSRLHSRPVLAHADPEWVYRSEVFGRLHPRDPERFPDLERVAEHSVEYQLSRDAVFGEYGFMYYGGGPHIGYLRGGKYAYMKRWKSTYCIREAVWHMYARSADRRIREFAFRTNRGLMDYYMVHHDGKRKVKGAFVQTDGGDALAGDNQSCLPFPWQGGSSLSIATTTHLDPFLWMYHMTGDRRAKDVVENYGEAVKKLLRPHVMRKGRPIQVLKAIAQTYSLTFDPQLRAAADALGDHLYKPGTATDVTDEKPAGVFYKLGPDVPSLVQAWRVFGSRRYYEMAHKSAEWWWHASVASPIQQYGYTLGYVGPWLYEQNGEPTIPEWLRVRLREAPTHYDSEKNLFRDYHAYIGAYNYFFLRDFPYVQDMVLRTGVLEKPLASAASYEPFGPSSAFLKKDQEERIDIWVKGFGDVRLRRADGSSTDFPILRTAGRTQLVIPMEAESGVYEVVSANRSVPHVVLARSGAAQSPVAGGVREPIFGAPGNRVPLVVHAPGYWRPWPEETPPRRIYFGVPEGEKAGRIFFEGFARLFGPDGKAFGNEPVSGWVKLPSDRPGVWSFELAKPKLVKVENLPPFFAMRSAEDYFDPGVAWERVEERPEPKSIPKEVVFIEGAVNTKGNQSLHLAPRRQFRMPAGPAHPSGDGTAFLPLSEGTIEFFYKPDWSTFDLDEKNVSLVSVTSKPKPWTLSYYMRPKMGEHFVYNLWGMAWRDGKWGKGTIRCYRRPTLIERDRWIHIAWTWSRELNRKHGFTSLQMFIYLDGRAGRCYGNGARYAHMVGTTSLLALHPGGAYDELRVSDVRRYREDFDPPSRRREMELDEHTRALFHFNGNLKGKSATAKEPIEGKLTK
ncbi:MAG: sugar-binding protein [Planctomycetota bacterium]|nr:sugar-binding protein [Planctomycetota bacterium]